MSGKERKFLIQNEIEIMILGIAYVGTLYSIMILATVLETYLYNINIWQ